MIKHHIKKGRVYEVFYDVAGYPVAETEPINIFSYLFRKLCNLRIQWKKKEILNENSKIF